MAAQLFLLPFRPAISTNSLVIPGAQLTFYKAGTTIKTSVFTTDTLTTPLPNPVVANSAGVWPTIYFDTSVSYRVDLSDSNNVLLKSVDPYLVGVLDGLTPALQTLVANAQTAQTGAETARDKAQDWAEGSGTPGGTGTKSAKSWAALAQVGVIAPSTLAQRAFGYPQRNLFELARASLNMQANASTGVLEPASGYYTSDFMNVVAFPQFAATRFGPSPTIFAYDSNKTYIGVVPNIGGSVTQRVDGGGLNSDVLVTLPAGVGYVRLTGLMYTDAASPNSYYTQPILSFPAQQLVLPGNAALPAWPNSGALLAASKPVMASDLSQWAGRTIAVQGDSKSTFEYGDQRWLEQCAAILGVGKVKNWAQAGRGMDGALMRGYSGQALVQADFTDVDALFLDLGINDYLNNVPLGAITDATTATTYYGYTRKAIEQYLTWKPSIRLFINTPTRINFNSKTDPIAYVTALKALAAVYSIAVNDLYMTSGDNALTINSRTIDPGLHHTPAGLIMAKTNPSLAFLKGVGSPPA